jgi:hypothetical protein
MLAVGLDIVSTLLPTFGASVDALVGLDCFSRSRFQRGGSVPLVAPAVPHD